jgi:hypothetical protein
MPPTQRPLRFEAAILSQWNDPVPNRSKERKGEQAIEGAKAMSEYIAERAAEHAKTARLRALRLAKEAVDNEAKTKKGRKSK